jgi:hypothetical protein
MMLSPRLAKTPAIFLYWVCLAAAAGEEPVDPAAEPVATESETKPAAEKAAEFKPPGFRAKKHGDVTLYCRRETVLGSRFKAEKCYDQAGVEEILRAESENKEILDKIRNCGVGTCPGG